MKNKLWQTLVNINQELVESLDLSKQVNTKDDLTPVTQLDLLASKILEEQLPKILNLPVVSEENVETFSQAPQGDYWLVDPIDGTKELIAGRREWTVNIALIQNKSVTWAGLSAPLLDEIFIGDCLGQQAFFMQGNKESILQRKPNTLEHLLQQKTLRILCSISHPEQELDHWLKAYKGTVKKVSVGSSLKFCRIAQNQADLYPRFVGLNTWDIAAGHGILKASGGNLWNMHTLAEVSYGNPFAKAPLFWAI